VLRLEGTATFEIPRVIKASLQGGGTRVDNRRTALAVFSLIGETAEAVTEVHRIEAPR